MSELLCCSCLLGGLHTAIWSCVCQHCRSDDSQLVTKCRQLWHTDLSVKLLPAMFTACDLTAAVSSHRIGLHIIWIAYNPSLYVQTACVRTCIQMSFHQISAGAVLPISAVIYCILLIRQLNVRYLIGCFFLSL